MRREISILWIEDNKNSVIKEIQNEVKAILRDFYYEPIIFDVTDIMSAQAQLDRQHFDLIFSDNSLPNGKEGVDFLTEYRSDNKYKYYILYSNLDENDIVDKIANKFKDKRKIHLFSNFDFMSLSDWQGRIDEVMAAFLNNQSKIETLRNIYIVENALIEDVLRNTSGISGNDYHDLINDYVRKNSVAQGIKDLWHKVRIDRNILAHGMITFAGGYNIASDNCGRQVSEANFMDKLQQMDKLIYYLRNLNLL